MENFLQMRMASISQAQAAVLMNGSRLVDVLQNASSFNPGPWLENGYVLPDFRDVLPQLT